MIIRWFWRDCRFRGKKWGVNPIDAFWVEATEEEAMVEIFPLLQPTEIIESINLADQFIEIVRELGSPARPFCFLAARDLSSIDPFHAHYPFHHMWNAYSPFEEIPPIHIRSLKEVKQIILPVAKNE